MRFTPAPYLPAQTEARLDGSRGGRDIEKQAEGSGRERLTSNNAHEPTERIDLPNEAALPDTAETWVTAHLADSVEALSH